MRDYKLYLTDILSAIESIELFVAVRTSWGRVLN